MLKFYFICIGLFYLSMLLFIIRCSVNKDKIIFKKNEEKDFIYVRFILMGILPAFNLVFVIAAIYVSILMQHQKFIKFMNE